jgi:hypothetical protein
MTFKTDDPIREAMTEVLDRIKKEKEESDRFDSNIDWASFFGADEHATEEEVDQMFEDQIC